VRGWERGYDEVVMTEAIAARRSQGSTTRLGHSNTATPLMPHIRIYTYA
jgi:hypothetical protein